MNLGFLVGNLFFEPARIRAILLVLVKREAYIIAKLNPGKILAKVQDTTDGFAKIGKVVAWLIVIP